jgi:hypothetical protein
MPILRLCSHICEVVEGWVDWNRSIRRASEQRAYADSSDPIKKKALQKSHLNRWLFIPASNVPGVVDRSRIILFDDDRYILLHNSTSDNILSYVMPFAVTHQFMSRAS